ncbi:DUF6292 family protein [Streptomyces sp. CA-278952]|uniref:DUF6292 family protein n=1 Tax=Streptomyces sp. CA-278952 TaxID=2980556 RepID=UPI00236788C3|nr:DUF6292 family protein [Streptomyces sp. CA-278952]WDG26833.1 DUF6292 family protein [Streptomyces sp. CA-278952]WDG33353.1 DUF6292 family protein [Streptomyces sp. CA-278952]
MIRAGRRHLVRTLADLAAQQGLRTERYLKLKPYEAPGFPPPVSSPKARTRLYDGEQVDAYLLGKPVPPLPDQDGDDDLLDRQECAAAIGVTPRTWDGYKRHPLLTEHVTDVGGVEHWPRGIVRQYQTSRPGKPTVTGRPEGTGDQVPRDQLPALTAELLDADPTISSAGVTEALGIHRDTAQEALTRLRADRMADLMHTDPSLTPDQAAVALGYPAGQVRRATARADTVLRARRAAPYLAGVTTALHRAGWTNTEAAPDVQFPGDDRVVAALVLDGDQAPAPALVWDERYGWRTAASRRHPLTKGAVLPPEGDGIRYLAGGITPPPGALIAALTR